MVIMQKNIIGKCARLKKKGDLRPSGQGGSLQEDTDQAEIS